MKRTRFTDLALALYMLVSACTSSPQTPATQVVVAITSDLTPKSQLSRIQIQLSKRDGSDVSSMQAFTLVDPTTKALKPGQQKLPVTFAIGKGQEASFLLVVTGYGPLGSGGAEEKIVEQRYIATFQDHATLLLQVFLGSVCLHQFCDGAGKKVCYPSAKGSVKAGECGALLPFGSGDLKQVDVGKLPDLSLLPAGVAKGDASLRDDAATDAGAADAADTSDASRSGDAGVNDPCSINHGGCDPLMSCKSSAGQVTCGACPSGYTRDANTCTDINECKAQTFDCKSHSTCKNIPGGYECPCANGYYGDGKQACMRSTLCNATGSNCDALASCKDVTGTKYCVCNAGYTGDGETCADIDECATNNGGCGSTSYASCKNNAGIAPTCTTIDVCASNNGGCGSSAYAACKNNLGVPPTCTTIDVCASNNGGCGSSAYATCKNNLGVAPTCTAIDVCASNNGGCGSPAYATCKNNLGVAPTCTAVNVCATNNGGCGSSTYATCKNNVGVAPTCTAVNVCATNNGGCGSATFYSCTNNVGTPPTCKDIGPCGGSNVCNSDYPCKYLGSSYTCRGQFQDWVPTYSASTFSINGNGTVTDSQSGLTWQQSLPATYAGCSGTGMAACKTLAEAKAYCSGLSLNGTGWRLPTLAELESIVDFGKSNPALDSTLFPSTPASAFWSCSPNVSDPTTTWTVNFSLGESVSTLPFNLNSYAVRCVR